MQLAAAFGGQLASIQHTLRAPTRVANVPLRLQPASCRHTAFAANSRLQKPHRRQARSTVVHSFEGDATKALKEAAALDELIDMLLSAKSQQEVGKLVAENIFSFDAKFWLRIATRADSAPSQADKDKLGDMANNVMVLVDAMVKQTEEKLSGSARVLQDIMTAAADENGEWYLPLAPEQVAKVRASLDANGDRLDEALLSNAFAWIRKCSEDRFDSMSALIQKVLQLYAARALRGPEKAGVEGCLNEVIFAEEEQWAPLLQRMASDGSISEAAFMEALQRKMEGTVLGMASGSYAQRVQAEYLKEVEARAKSVFRERAGGSSSSES